MNEALVLIVVAILALCLGYPVALTLGGIAIIFALSASTIGSFDPALFYAIAPRIFAIFTNPILQAVPLFIFMGVAMQKTGLANNMFQAISNSNNSNRSLAIVVVLVGAILAACSGIVGASIATLGLMAMPTMMKQNISHQKISGCIISTATLAQIMPPSIMLIILADQMSIAHQLTQNKLGKFDTDPILVPDMFAAAILPALLLIILYIIWQYITNEKTPIQKTTIKNKKKIYENVILPFVLIISTLIILLLGYATPNEAASLAAAIIILLATKQFSKWQFNFGIIGFCFFIFSQIINQQIIAYIACIFIFISIAFSFILLWKKNILTAIFTETLRLVCVIFLIIFATSIFALVFRGLGGDELIYATLHNMPGGTLGAILFVMAVIFVLGFFLEFIEITYLVIPLAVPILLAMEMPNGFAVDPLWLGILIALNLQTSFLTPPIGISLFYFRSIACDKIKMTEIYKGVTPYIFMQLLVLLFVFLYPVLATWLPTIRN